MTQTASEETLSSIGNTPLVKLDSLSGSAGDFYAKLLHNPFGSVKDRAAYWMIKDGEERGKLVSGKSIIIEPTSGMGIALPSIKADSIYILGSKVEIGTYLKKHSQETKDIIKILAPRSCETVENELAIQLQVKKVRRSSLLVQYINNNLNPYRWTSTPDVWNLTLFGTKFFKTI